MLCSIQPLLWVVEGRKASGLRRELKDALQDLESGREDKGKKTMELQQETNSTGFVRVRGHF